MRLHICGLALAAAASAAPVRAETHDACDSFVDALPASLQPAGVHCLRHDLATAIDTGAAITMIPPAAAMVLDCNGFAIRGSAGSATTAVGIRYLGGDGTHVTIRNCRIEGFQSGIEFDGSGRIIGNTIVGSYVNGIFVSRNAVEIVGNRVSRIGGSPARTNTTGINTGGADHLIADNIVDDVGPGMEPSVATGIATLGQSVVVRGNRIRRVHATSSFGIAPALGVTGVYVENHVAGAMTGISCHSSAFLVRNTFSDIAGTPVVGSCQSVGNRVIE